MSARKLAYISVTAALALVLSYLESLLPVFAAVPGIKAGLANIAVIFALYKFGFREALTVSAVRVVLSALLFGSVLSLAYSATGAAVSLAGMALLKKTNLFSPVAVSVCGGVLHNLAQVLTACLILGTDALKFYIPVLLVSGVAAGAVTGVISAVIIKRVDV